MTTGSTAHTVSVTVDNPSRRTLVDDLLVCEESLHRQEGRCEGPFEHANTQFQPLGRSLGDQEPGHEFWQTAVEGLRLGQGIVLLAECGECAAGLGHHGSDLVFQVVVHRLSKASVVGTPKVGRGGGPQSAATPHGGAS